jgi:hypothetical protein
MEEQEPIVKEIRLPDGRLTSLEEALAFEEVVPGDYLVVLDKGEWRSLYSVEEKKGALFGEECKKQVRCQRNNISPDIISANFYPDAAYDDVSHEQLAQFSREFTNCIYEKPNWVHNLVYLDDGWAFKVRGVIDFHLVNCDEVERVEADVTSVPSSQKIATNVRSYGQAEFWQGFPFQSHIGFFWESCSGNIALAIPDEDDTKTYSVYVKLGEKVRQERDFCQYGEYLAKILS